MCAQRQHGIALVRPRSLEELIVEFGGDVDDGVDIHRTIRSIGASDRTGAFDLAPVLHARGAATVATNAPVLLVSAAVASRVLAGRRWVHPQGARVLATLLAIDEPPQFAAPSWVQVEATGSLVASTAQLGVGVTLGARTRIGPNAVVYSNVTLGAGVTIGAGAIVGAPGFGFADDPLDASVPPIRFPHRAGVVLEDGVEIGPVCTIDAGVLFPTTLGAQTKLDAHVHVGHGVQIGANCRVAAQVGFAGSVVVEDDVHIGGQAGFGDHVHIGRGARIAGKAGVIGDVAAGAVVAGYPAVPRMRWLRGHARLYRQ